MGCIRHTRDQLHRVLICLALLSGRALGQTRALGVTPLDGSGSGGGSGTVTSVDNGTIGSLFSISWATTTTTPRISLDMATCTANKVIASGTSGGAAVPTCRALVTADLPTITLASAQFANQGTTTTVLHGNASGNPSFGAIVNADITNATIDLTTKVTGTLPAGNGGTGSAFTEFSGPGTSKKTFTLPNASATILTDNAAVTVAQGGSGAATLTGILKGNGTSAFTAVTAPSGAIVGDTDTQTLTNKTLTSPVIDARVGSAGTAMTTTATAPTAAASTTAGPGVSITGGAATAGTTNAGAAAGGAVTITGGAAAQKTSGNADGGNVIAAGGAPVGTGITGHFVFPDGSTSAPGISMTSDLTTGFGRAGANLWGWIFAGSLKFYFGNAAILPNGAGATSLGTGSSTSFSKLYIDYTNTATIGAVTINKAAGFVNVASGASTVVVTDSFCNSTNVHVLAVASFVDATCAVKAVVPSAGSFTITMTANCTSNTQVTFFIVNAD